MISENAKNLRRGAGKTHKLIRKYFNKNDSQEDIEFVANLYSKRPPNTRAVTTPADWLFIHDFISCLRPTSVIEIGVASGMSSALIHSSMKKNGLLQEQINDKKLYSLDILEYVPWDNEKKFPVGFAVESIFEGHNLESVWSLNLKRTSLDLIKSLAINLGNKPLAFVDGNHSHPWPLIDLVILTKIMPPYSWILLQDIAIMERAYLEAQKFNLDNVNYGSRGAQLVYEYWPGDKIRGVDDSFNMAAVQIPNDKYSLLKKLFQLKSYEAEAQVNDAMYFFLEGVFAGI